MKQIAAKYRREDGGLDLCAASCIELDDRVLQEGVPEEGYRIATPPLSVPRQDMTSTIGQTDAEDDEGWEKWRRRRVRGRCTRNLAMCCTSGPGRGR